MSVNLKIQIRIGVQQDYIGYHLKKSGLNIYKSNESIEGNFFQPHWKCLELFVQKMDQKFGSK